MTEDLENIEEHLKQFEQRTHRPLHMDVLHVCSDLKQAQGEINQLRAKLEAERNKRVSAEHLCDAQSNMFANISDTLRSRGFPASLGRPTDVRVIEMAKAHDEAKVALRQCVEALAQILSAAAVCKIHATEVGDADFLNALLPRIEQAEQALAAAKGVTQ